MSLGLCNAPETFERLIEVIFHELIDKICIVYLDDVVVFGSIVDV